MIGHVSVSTGSLSTKDLASLKRYGDAANQNDKIQARMRMSSELSGLTRAELDRIYLKCLSERRLPSSEEARETLKATNRDKSVNLLHPVRDHLDPKALEAFQGHIGHTLWEGVGPESEGCDALNHENLATKLDPRKPEMAVPTEAGIIVNVLGVNGEAYDQPAASILTKVIEADKQPMLESDSRSTLMKLAEPEFKVEDLSSAQKVEVAEHAGTLTGLAVEDFLDLRTKPKADVDTASRNLSLVLHRLKDVTKESGVTPPSLVA